MGSLDDSDDRSKQLLPVRFMLKHKYTIGMGCCVTMLVIVMVIMSPSTIKNSSMMAWSTSSTSSSTSPVVLISTEDLKERLADLRGDDVRLVRWDATPHTKDRQFDSCQEGLPDALAVILAPSLTKQTTRRKEEHKELRKGLACEYATFCITDNHKQRARLSQYKTNKNSGADSGSSSSGADKDDKKKIRIYTSIVNLVASDQMYTSAMASHLIYIATFSNRANQEGFAKAGAVSKLATAVQEHQPASSSSSSPHNHNNNLSIMWAAAALQNLAASYCDTEGGGRCYWEWMKKERNEMKLTLQPEMQILSDGTPIRREMLNDANLMRRLMELACTGPVRGEMTNQNPYVGENAVAGNPHHEASSNILAWAAAGALKNVAISAHLWTTILVETTTAAPPTTVLPNSRDDIMHCLCRLAHSPDWLEGNKGQGALRYLRPTDPCWFQDDNKTTGNLCVDHAFVDTEGYTCSDYGHATEEECLATDDRGVNAKKACCACGGGDPEESWALTTKTR